MFIIDYITITITITINYYYYYYYLPIYTTCYCVPNFLVQRMLGFKLARFLSFRFPRYLVLICNVLAMNGAMSTKVHNDKVEAEERKL